MRVVFLDKFKALLSSFWVLQLIGWALYGVLIYITFLTVGLMVARGLAKQQTRTLGMIAPNIANPFWPEVVRGVVRPGRGLGMVLHREHRPLAVPQPFARVVVEIDVTRLPAALRDRLDDVVDVRRSGLVDEFEVPLGLYLQAALTESRRETLGPGTRIFADFEFPGADQWRLRVRADFFNLFNRANFRGPNMTALRAVCPAAASTVKAAQTRTTASQSMKPVV